MPRQYPPYRPRPISDADVQAHEVHKDRPVEQMPIESCRLCRAIFEVE